MAISKDIRDRQFTSLIESTAVATQVAQAVVNPDGTNISGGGGGADPVGLKNVAATPINPATEDTLALIKAKTDNVDVALSTRALESGGNLAAAATSLGVMDDWDETDRAKVNPIAGQVGVQGGSGVVTALTQRTVLATDVALPAGTNAIGKLAANSGVDIGDVDVTSVVAGTGATNLGKAEDVAHSSGDTGVFALSVRKSVPASSAGSDEDYAALVTDQNGRLYTAGFEINPAWTLTVTEVAATGDTTVIAAAGGGLKNRVHLIIVENLDITDATNIHFEEAGSASTIDGLNKKYIPAYGGQKEWDFRGKGVLQATTNTAIQVNSTGSDLFVVWAWFTTE